VTVTVMSILVTSGAPPPPRVGQVCFRAWLGLLVTPSIQDRTVFTAAVQECGHVHLMECWFRCAMVFAVAIAQLRAAAGVGTSTCGADLCAAVLCWRGLSTRLRTEACAALGPV
jgi:hypothetical protein